MKNPFKIYKMEYIIFVIFLVSSLLLLSLLGVISYRTTNQEVLDLTIHSRTVLLDEIYKNIKSKMSAFESDTLFFSSNPKVIKYLNNSGEYYEFGQLSSEIVDELIRLVYVNQAIHSVQLYAKNIRFTKNYGVNGVFDYSYIVSTPWYSQIEKTDFSWIGAHSLGLDNYVLGKDTVISFARKIFSPVSGEELGVVIVNLKTSFVEEIISNGTNMVDRYLIDDSGNIIASITDDSPQVQTEEIDFIGMIDEVNDKQYTTLTKDYKKLVIWTNENIRPWIIVDIVPWDILTEGSERVGKAIIVTSAISIVLAFLIAFILSRQFSHPIKRLIRIMNQMKSGRLNVRVKMDYKNEFGQLNNHFNQMLDQINSLLTEIQRQNLLKREKELQVLQEQINPHFLYNTLDMINWRAIELQNYDVSKMLSLLGKMIRIGLSGGSSFLTIQKEIEHLGYYMELQKIRYENKIKFTISVQESINNYVIPKLILQPYVENAFHHAFESRNEGFIRVVGYEERESIWFFIEDNGIGMDLTERDQILKKGYGIRNVMERIKLYYGEQYGVKIESVMGEGTKISIQLSKEVPELKAGE